jgi:uncharacterized DUF497 family protein
MEIEKFVWRRANRAKLASHGISADEADSVLDDDAWVTYVHDDYPNQIRAIGQTKRRRVIVLVLDPTEHPTRWRPVTGWEAMPWEIAYYREEYR